MKTLVQFRSGDVIAFTYNGVHRQGKVEAVKVGRNGQAYVVLDVYVECRDGGMDFDGGFKSFYVDRMGDDIEVE